MRRGWQQMLGCAAAGVCIATSVAMGAGADPAAEEADLLARRLVKENLELQAEIAGLRSERDGLLARLAGEQYASDRLQVVYERLPDATQERMDVAPTGWRVVDANRDLGLVALSAGSMDGLRSGLPLAVVRDGVVVARVKIVEVRERVAAARIEALADARFPQEGDRAVVWRSRRE